MKLQLPQITLVALTNKDFEGHKKAIDESCRGIEFGAVKIIWDEKCTSIDEWNRKIVYELGDYVDTPFALLIHADGYVINPELWDDKWLNYDFIGSPFPLPQDDFSYRDINGKIQRVGNSVSLRSKRLLDLPKKIGMEWKPFHGFYNEDGFISVNMRHVFEEHGCRFAPLEVAVYFGKEHEIPENAGLKTFLFHQV
jgi:hypothetical protein